MTQTSHISTISSGELLCHLCASVTAIRSDVLRFTAGEVGLHSIRSGAVMAMYLNKIPVFTIMLIGCWSSDAFLHYIWKQVQEFSKGVSSAMITSDDFFTIPELSAEDPRTSGHHLNLSLHNNCGRDALSNSTMPRFALFHWGTARILICLQPTHCGFCVSDSYYLTSEMCRIMGFGEERSSFRNLFSKPTPGFLLLNVLPDVCVLRICIWECKKCLYSVLVIYLYISCQRDQSSLSFQRATVVNKLSSKYLCWLYTILLHFRYLYWR